MNLVNLKNMISSVQINKYCPIYSIFIKHTKKSTCSNVTYLWARKIRKIFYTSCFKKIKSVF